MGAQIEIIYTPTPEGEANNLTNEELNKTVNSLLEEMGIAPNDKFDVQILSQKKLAN